ncbi:MAG: DUF4129 domain-containing protein [Limisphaerales bacterium]
MASRRPQKTFVDYLVIGASPVLIMLLVGSLVFFLIQVFYRGDMVLGVRWVMFWFVLAIVLVSRIGIEQGTGYAVVYGLGLAGATWLYLARTHPAYFLGLILLAVVWWSAHKLTWDCTLIDEDQDASGHGLLQFAGRGKSHAQPEKQPASGHGAKKAARAFSLGNARKRPAAPPHPPGAWVVYFSLGALPLFGIGQVLLASDDTESRRIVFGFLLVYLVAALSLLLTTSFLGLRRYLRQRRLVMPGNVAFGWIRFGVGVVIAVLAVALTLPRPGADYTWRTLSYRIDYQLRRASEYAARLNPAGTGRGRAGGQSGAAGEQATRDQGADAQAGATPSAGAGAAGADGQAGGKQKTLQGESAPILGQAARLYAWLRTLLFLAAAVLLTWWLIRRRRVILEMIRSLAQALAQFFRNLFGFGLRSKSSLAPEIKPPASKLRPFADYRNPFVTGKDRVWPPERLVAYSFEALQAWAKEQGAEPQPQQTPREFCLNLREKFPEAAFGLDRLSFLYGHAAYGRKLPDPCDVEPVRQLWRYLAESMTAIATR